MYTGNNPSALRSRNEIVGAFFALLQQHPFEEITVKQIMLSSDLSRQTFYQIFASKEDILEYYMDTVFAQFIENYENLTVSNLCDAAKLFFSFFEQHKDMLRLIIHNGKSCILQKKFRAYLQQQSIHYKLEGVRSEAEQAYAVTFVISGMVTMLEQWLQEGAVPALTPEELALLVCRITGTEV